MTTETSYKSENPYIVKEYDRRVGGYTVRRFHSVTTGGGWSEVLAAFATLPEAKAYLAAALKGDVA